MSKSATFEFALDSIREDGLFLGGNNGQNDIPVGTTFTTVRRMRYQNHAEKGIESFDEGIVGAISLTIQVVHFYRHIIDAVPGGHSAGIAVSGEGLESLKHLLCGLPKNERLVLEASV